MSLFRSVNCIPQNLEYDRQALPYFTRSWFEWEICDFIYSVGSSCFDHEECLAPAWLFICSCDVRNYTGNPYADFKVIRHAWMHLVSLPVYNEGTIQLKNHNFIDNEPTFSVEILCYSNFFFWKFFRILQSHGLSSHWLSWSYYGSQCYGRM